MLSSLGVFLLYMQMQMLNGHALLTIFQTRFFRKKTKICCNFIHHHFLSITTSMALARLGALLSFVTGLMVTS